MSTSAETSSLLPRLAPIKGVCGFCLSLSTAAEMIGVTSPNETSDGDPARSIVLGADDFFIADLRAFLVAGTAESDAATSDSGLDISALRTYTCQVQVYTSHEVTCVYTRRQHQKPRGALYTSKP
jgi:hypothetical protein